MKKVLVVFLIVVLLCGCATEKNVDKREENKATSELAGAEPGSEFPENGDGTSFDEQVEEYISCLIGNINSKKFHLPTCHTLPYPENQIIFEDEKTAEEEGYIPCQNCLP